MENRRQSPAVILFFLAAAAVAVQSQAQWSAGSSTDPAVPTYRAGAVGIGLTGTPPAQLAVKQSADTVGGGLKVIRSGSATSYADFYIGGDNQAYIQVNGGGAYLTLTGGGSAGIGTTIPNAGSKLDVRGGLSINQVQTATQRGTGVDVGWTGSGNADVYFGDYTNGWAIGENVDASMRIFKTNGNTLSSTPLTIQASGSVGIGTTVPNAGSKLDVRGGFSVNQVQTATQRGSGVDVGWTGSGNADVYFGEYTNGWAIGENVDSSMRIFKTSGNTLSSTPLTIQAGGRVGIGTIAPQTALHVSNGAGTSLTLEGDPSGTPTNVNFSADSGPQTKAQVAGSKYGATGGILHFSILKESVLTEAMTIRETGNVGIGKQPDSGYALDVAGGMHTTGNITADGTVRATFQDVAEWVPVLEEMAPGTVVVVSADAKNTVAPSKGAYDTRVAGVVSPTPGLLLGVESSSKAKIATTGRVKVRVDASRSAIHLGDLLVTSDTPGTAMKSEPLDLGGLKIHRPGTLIGKALEPLASGQGEILVLLSLQ